MKNQFSYFVILLFSIFHSGNISAQGTAVFEQSSEITSDFSWEDEPSTIFQVLSNSGILKISLETDWDHLIANKNKDEYQAGKMVFVSDDNEVVHSVKIKPRGKSRRRFCSFPPLKIKFNKSELSDQGIATKHKSLKLVTHCLEEDDAEQTLLKEYVAYKMYNILTEASLKVQLVEITYINSAKDTIDSVNYGFFIEDIDELAERNDGVEIEGVFNMTLDSINKTYRHVIPMFQYMIANMDWKPHMLQNIKIVEKFDGERLMVPYDFDFSGLVDAPYAVPSIDHRQTDIKQRLYMNKVDDIEELRPTIRFFQIHKDEILKTIQDCEELNKKNKRKMISYIRDFYVTLDNDYLSKEAFVKPDIISNSKMINKAENSN